MPSSFHSEPQLSMVIQAQAADRIPPVGEEYVETAAEKQARFSGT
jgi:hypothetical protein